MIRLGTDAQFAVVRDFLRSRYTDPLVAAALGVRSVTEFDRRDRAQPIRDVLTRVLFGGAAVPAGAMHQSMPASVCHTMVELGLLAQAEGRMWCPVVVYPLGDLHLISDRFLQPDGAVAAADREFVYFALTQNTLSFLATLPSAAVESFLDIGGGCGAAALLQARYAGRAVSSDISERCALYAEFNRRLNGVANCESLLGSLYEPVAGQRFARIACHPPYDCSATTPWTFADGGEDGEFVIRGAIAGLPDHLAAGGEFVSEFRGADVAGRPLEMRIREWLGERQAEFDVAVVVRGVVELEEYALSQVTTGKAPPDQFQAYLAAFHERAVEALPYCSVLIHRGGFESPVTVRARMGDAGCTYAHLRALLDGERQVGVSDRVRLAVSPHLELVVRHKPRDGSLRAEAYQIRICSPFRREIDCPEWVTLLLAKCDGSRNVPAVCRELQNDCPVPEPHVRAAIHRLVNAGALIPVAG